MWTQPMFTCFLLFQVRLIKIFFNAIFVKKHHQTLHRTPNNCGSSFWVRSICRNNNQNRGNPASGRIKFEVTPAPRRCRFFRFPFLPDVWRQNPSWRPVILGIFLTKKRHFGEGFTMGKNIQFFWVISELTQSCWMVATQIIIFYFNPYLGKTPILTNIVQMGWNHQPGIHRRTPICMSV